MTKVTIAERDYEQCPTCALIAEGSSMSYSDNTCPQVVRCNGDNTNGEDDDKCDRECDGDGDGDGDGNGDDDGNCDDDANGDDDYDGHAYGSLCGEAFLLKQGEIVDSRICSGI